jgi:hypothetical protein
MENLPKNHKKQRGNLGQISIIFFSFQIYLLLLGKKVIREGLLFPENLTF